MTDNTDEIARPRSEAEDDLKHAAALEAWPAEVRRVIREIIDDLKCLERGSSSRRKKP